LAQPTSKVDTSRKKTLISDSALNKVELRVAGKSKQVNHFNQVQCSTNGKEPKDEKRAPRCPLSDFDFLII
jgi:hypothetical protein